MSGETHAARSQPAAGRLESMTVDALLESIAAKQPAPGGGAVASVTAALGAALARMVLSYSVGRRSLAEHADLHREATGRLETLSARALELAEEDAEVSARMIGLWKLDADDPHRRAEWPAAVRAAIAAPREVLATCLRVLEVTEQLVGRSNALLRSDLAIAAILAEAAARSAVWNVLVNLPQLGDEERERDIRLECERLLAEAAERCRRIEEGCGR